MSACEIHRYHRPRVLRGEAHHIIPRAWQGMWQPLDAPVADVSMADYDKIVYGKKGRPLGSPHNTPGFEEWKHGVQQRTLWHEDTMMLCPTAHSNVHVLLVKIMKAYEAARISQPHVLAAFPMAAAVKTIREEMGRSKEFDVALMAPTLWLKRGGSLDLLVKLNHYGYGIRSRDN